MYPLHSLFFKKVGDLLSAKEKDMEVEVIGERKICSFCKKMLNANFSIAMYYKGFYYHDECFAMFDDQTLKGSEEMLMRKKELVAYIRLLFKTNEISPKINAQIKRFIDSNYTYEGITKTLEYFYGVKKNGTERANNGIGIVPHVYAEARQWYFDNYNKKQTIEKNSHKMIETEPRVIIVSVPEDDCVERKMINIESL